MVTAVIGAKTYAVSLESGGHRLMADEPVAMGGDNQGPTPESFVKMALASCTAITLRMYAQRKGWALRGVMVQVDTIKEGNRTIFNRHVQVEGDLAEDQRERLLQIARSCPVHKLLTQPIDIQTTLS
ncbi:MAG: OsmC family protein [Cyclobacteriaceae bacterium]|nr:OsmC family protein [Cyclobacteriaceae bacterium]